MFLLESARRVVDVDQKRVKEESSIVVEKTHASTVLIRSREDEIVWNDIAIKDDRKGGREVVVDELLRCECCHTRLSKRIEVDV